MSRAVLIRWVKVLVRFALPALVLVFFAIQVKNNWSALASHRFEWNPVLLGLAFLGFVLQELSFGLIWKNVLARLGYHLPLGASLRIYLGTEFVRYIPGNVWHVLTRILWVGKYGVPRSLAFTSMVVELVTKLATAAFIFALSLLFWRDVHALGSTQGLFFLTFSAVAMLAVLIGLHPRILGGLLNLALRLLRREPVTLALRYRDILLVSFFWCLSWLIAGLAFYGLVLALWPTTPLGALPICIGIYALGWDIGFISFITPSGLGFREGAIALLFTFSLPTLPAALGYVIALLSRLVSTLAELLCVSVAYLSGLRQIRQIRAEQAAEQAERQGAKPSDEHLAAPKDETISPPLTATIGYEEQKEREAQIPQAAVSEETVASHDGRRGYEN
ncbi:MAG: flippase-like domain-containing protein [Thermogemmatispora sp.]|uniref:lysylphosphatidylglycerol synthase transmembrane domain-containing protein n=1 Tax=Thermogemmatispora sp. TaxID=1968838 RepID=UPI001A0DBC96|nr:lysylphosphatidylglycerol synthase transmembrane domain-containing protein [Thermogemmatispora sp.]MBE3567705.1 flippase-like domain-containing protein [Thermogemmatispora sp.]